jgi:hypothetical protein
MSTEYRNISENTTNDVLQICVQGQLRCCFFHDNLYYILDWFVKKKLHVQMTWLTINSLEPNFMILNLESHSIGLGAPILQQILQHACCNTRNCMRQMIWSIVFIKHCGCNTNHFTNTILKMWFSVQILLLT